MQKPLQAQNIIRKSVLEPFFLSLGKYLHRRREDRLRINPLSGKFHGKLIQLVFLLSYAKINVSLLLICSLEDLGVF